VVPGQVYSLIAWERNRSQAEDSPDDVICRIGYDPAGGGDSLSPSVIWHEFSHSENVWQSAFMEVIPYAPTMTVFLEVRRKNISEAASDSCVWFDGVSLNGYIKAPSVPVVRALYVDDSTISADWSCADNDVIGYEYALSLMSDEGGVLSYGKWKSVGLETSVTNTGLTLSNGDLIRVVVRAKNSYGVYSEIGVSEPIRVAWETTNLSSIKSIQDGIWVQIADLYVSRMGFGAECFLQDANRVPGIKAEGDMLDIPYLQPGTKVTVAGCLATDGAMRIIRSAELKPSIVLDPPKSICMQSRSIVSGINMGLLVTLIGRVMDASANTFILRDGSLKDGLTVACFNSATPPAIGSFVRATGIATSYGLAVYGAGDLVEVGER